MIPITTFFKRAILLSILFIGFTIYVEAEDVPTYEAQYPINSGLSFFNPAVVKKSTDGILYVAGSGINAETSDNIVVVMRFNGGGQEISRGSYTASGSVVDLAIDGSGNSYVLLYEFFESNIYKFSPSGGTPIDSLNLSGANVGGGNGLKFDRDRDRLYVCYVTFNSGSPLIVIEAYDSDLDPVESVNRDFGALEFDNNPSGFASISLDASGNVYEGGWANSGAGFYYTAHKYSPSLASEVWSSSKSAEGAFSGTNQVFTHVTPTGQLVFLSEEDNDEENVIFRVGTTGTFLNDDTNLGFSFINALGVDGQGNAYAVGTSEANSLPAVAKLDSSEDYVWSPTIWEDGSVGGYGAIDIDSGYDIHLGGFSLDFSSAIVYRYGQEVEFEQDTSSPSAIQNLSISSSTASTATLGWTAPGDDGTIGTAASYEIRYASGVAITTANYNSASIWKSSRTVTVSGGTVDQETITGLAPATTYFFAIKTRDEVFNISDVSNSTGVFLQGDITSPGTITNLIVTIFSSNTLSLQWTAPGDDGTTGMVASYDIRYRIGTEITDSNFGTSSSIIKIATDAAGAPAIVAISGLDHGTEYYFAVKARDEVLNTSSISNSPRGRTLIGVPYFNQADAPWGTQTYDGTSSLIKKKGCALSSLAMIINYYAEYHPDPVLRAKFGKTDPEKLNVWLTTSNGYNGNGDVKFPRIVQYTSGAVSLSEMVFGQDDDRINSDLINRTPTILTVNNDGHFIVSIGSSTSERFILDAGSRAAHNLLPYGNTYSGLRRFATGQVDLSIIQISAQSPIQLLLTDSQGRRTGFDTVTETIISEIPKSSYGEEGLDDDETGDPGPRSKNLWVGTPPQGSYTLTIIGIGSGSYRLDIDAYDQFGNYVLDITSGTVTPDAIKHMFINYSSTGGPIQIFEDNDPPNSVTNLVGNSSANNSVQLNWTAPGDDGTTGKAIRYDVRYATYGITAGNFAQSTTFYQSLTPQASGFAESLTVTGLSASTTYYFAMKSVDPAGNWSALSNAATAQTLSSNEIIGLIREDCFGYSNCYNTLKDWEENVGGVDFGTCTVGNLVCAKKIAVAKIDGSWVDADTQPVTFNGWTTSTTHYISVFTSSEARHNGTIGTGYRMEMDYETPIIIQENFIRIDGVSFRKGGSNPGEIVLIDYETDSNSRIEVTNCYFRGDYSGAISGISVNGGNSNQKKVWIWNNILENFAGGSCHGIKCAFGTVHAYNNTVVNSRYGIRRTAGTLIAKNNLNYNNQTDYAGTFSSSSTHNLSKDATAPSTGTYYHNATVLFVSTSNNFHLVSTDTGAVNNGTNLSVEFTNDIDGQTRSGTWDLGADEYMVGGGGGGGAPAFGLPGQGDDAFRAPFIDPTFRLNEVYAYPNPAYNGTRPTIHIECGLAESVELRIYDISGDLLHEGRFADQPLVIDNKYAYEYTWDAGGVASGVYVYVVLARKTGESPIKVMKKLAIVK